MNKIIVSKNNKSEKLIKEYPNFLFVYGNLYIPNTINKYSNVTGLSIRKGFGRERNAWWQKNELERFKERIDNEFIIIKNHLDKGAFVVLPSEPLGKDKTSQLLKFNPEMYSYVNRKIEELKEKYGINTSFKI